MLARLTPSYRVATTIALLCLTATNAATQEKRFVTAEHANFKATVSLLDGTATLRLQPTTGVPTEVPLGSNWQGVSALKFSPSASRIVLIGNAATTQLTIVETSMGRALASYSVVSAAVAPDGRAVIMERSQDAAAGTPQYSLVAVDAPEGTTPINLYPAGGGQKQRKLSDFFWVDPEVVAFVGSYDSSPRVVALRVDRTGRIENRAEKVLVDGAPPMDAFRRMTITRLPSAGLNLRLAFPGDRTMDVQLW